MNGNTSRKGSRDISGVRMHKVLAHRSPVPWTRHAQVGTGLEDTRVVREGDKVYVITEYSLQEEQDQEQPRSLCLVSLAVLTHVSDVMCTSDFCCEEAAQEVYNCGNLCLSLLSEFPPFIAIKMPYSIFML